MPSANPRRFSGSTTNVSGTSTTSLGAAGRRDDAHGRLDAATGATLSEGMGAQRAMSKVDQHLQQLSSLSDNY